MKHRKFLSAVDVFGLYLLSGLADAAGNSQRPNIVFIMCDQWRKQALGFLNEDRALMPNLDTLASGGAMFLNAYATVPVCGPNRACLLSTNWAEVDGSRSDNNVRVSLFSGLRNKDQRR